MNAAVNYTNLQLSYHSPSIQLLRFVRGVTWLHVSATKNNHLQATKNIQGVPGGM